MKLLTLNFLTCAVKTCKADPTASFPLHVRDAELESVELDFNPLFLRNVMPRLEWDAMQSICGEVGLTLPAVPGFGEPPKVKEDEKMEDVEGAGAEAEGSAGKEEEVQEETLKKLHELLIETQIVTGKLVCGNCGHEYHVREGIANFLLPAHLV